ncbi:peptidoglycan recognition protein family protein [Nannocystis bainbridge]|uniref:Peptidoglycan recognition family protein n=1 Tax=Nannocystis bainbridge TaxID=2995303 RepID=A0ABT5E768_9BACT|nr:peptidoglycan recognition family protein [Nannocystis bainbridge]MDC0720662.1 peptidoglycan recognition family protein [Nannocystis bainbridge]
MSRSLVGFAVALAVVLALAGPPQKTTPKPGPTPQPGPQAPAPDDDAPNPLDLPVALVDLRGKAPKSYIRRRRSPSDVRALVLHQTGFTWQPSNPKWAEVRAHFVVRRDGSVVMNFDPIQQMRFGSSLANPFSITIEFEGNYPSADGKWWKPEAFGANHLQDAPQQVNAGRRLIAGLRQLYPSITHVYAHRQWEAKKSNCPGPDLWRSIGEYAINQLGLKDGGADWHYTGGMAIPASWRTAWA